MTTEIRDCQNPKCGAKDSLETFLRIDLDDVVVREEDGLVVDFTLAGSANDADNGLVVEEARVTCRECGHEFPGAYVPHSFTDRWLYYDRSPRQEQARKVAHLLNRGMPPTVALQQLGIDPEDVTSEDASALSLDDPDNAVLDFGYNDHGECVYLQRHDQRWHVHVVRKEPNDA